MVKQYIIKKTHTRYKKNMSRSKYGQVCGIRLHKQNQNQCLIRLNYALDGIEKKQALYNLKKKISPYGQGHHILGVSNLDVSVYKEYRKGVGKLKEGTKFESQGSLPSSLTYPSKDMVSKVATSYQIQMGYSEGCRSLIMIQLNFCLTWANVTVWFQQYVTAI